MCCVLTIIVERDIIELWWNRRESNSYCWNAKPVSYRWTTTPKGLLMSTMISRQCDHCQARYAAEVRYLKRGQGLYCSRSCSSKSAQERRAKTQRPNVSCAVCSVPFYTKPSRIVKSKSGLFFCSKEHQDEAYRAGIVKPGPVATGKSVSRCKCGVPYGGTRGMCRRCYRDNIVQQWLSGNNDITLYKGTDGHPKDTKPFVKKYLIETRGDRCEQCGFDEKSPDGRSIIQMDHVDGNCFNNDPSNLKLLCPNHHAMTSTYGSLNKGSGRAHRRKKT